MNLLFFCLIILKFSVYEIPIFVHVKVIFCSSHNINSEFMKYQVLLEHPRLRTRKSLYSVLTLFSLFPRVRLAF